MYLNAFRKSIYADLGDAWLRDQAARLHQKHVQSGRHFRLEVDALLARAARAARAARIAKTQTARERAPGRVVAEALAA